MTRAHERGDDGGGPVGRFSDRVFHHGENVVYAASGVVLLAGAAVALGGIVWRLVQDVGEGVNDAVTAALDGLLLVFILLELLAAVRATMVERKLVAEPFLLVGIIASIKEIVVSTLEAQDYKGKPGDKFEHAMIEIGVLAGLVVLLAVATLLVRRKEREPAEEEGSGATSSR